HFDACDGQTVRRTLHCRSPPSPRFTLLWSLCPPRGICYSAPIICSSKPRTRPSKNPDACFKPVRKSGKDDDYCARRVGSDDYDSRCGHSSRLMAREELAAAVEKSPGRSGAFKKLTIKGIQGSRCPSRLLKKLGR